MSTDQYKDLTKALDKLAINDAALTYEKDSSAALGFGFRCGFLGLLHLDVIQERLQREFDLGLVISAPSVKYKISLKTGEEIEVDNPSYWPDPTVIEEITEPFYQGFNHHTRRIRRPCDGTLPRTSQRITNDEFPFDWPDGGRQ